MLTLQTPVSEQVQVLEDMSGLNLHYVYYQQFGWAGGVKLSKKSKSNNNIMILLGWAKLWDCFSFIAVCSSARSRKVFSLDCSTMKSNCACTGSVSKKQAACSPFYITVKHIPRKCLIEIFFAFVHFFPLPSDRRSLKTSTKLFFIRSQFSI